MEEDDTTQVLTPDDKEKLVKKIEQQQEENEEQEEDWSTPGILASNNPGCRIPSNILAQSLFDRYKLLNS